MASRPPAHSYSDGVSPITTSVLTTPSESTAHLAREKLDHVAPKEDDREHESRACGAWRLNVAPSHRLHRQIARKEVGRDRRVASTTRMVIRNGRFQLIGVLSLLLFAGALAL